MIRLIFFPAARLIDPVSSENAPRFPLSEIKHTLFIWGWQCGAFHTVSGNEMWHLTVQCHHVCCITNFNTINHPSHKKHVENENWKRIKSLKLREILVKTPPSQYFKNSGRMYCVWETSFIYATFPSSVCVHTAYPRCCSTLSTLHPMMSEGHNHRKSTGRMSYLCMPRFPSLPLSLMSL